MNIISLLDKINTSKINDDCQTPDPYETGDYETDLLAYEKVKLAMIEIIHIANTLADSYNILLPHEECNHCGENILVFEQLIIGKDGSNELNSLRFSLDGYLVETFLMYSRMVKKDPDKGYSADNIEFDNTLERQRLNLESEFDHKTINGAKRIYIRGIHIEMINNALQDFLKDIQTKLAEQEAG